MNSLATDRGVEDQINIPSADCLRMEPGFLQSSQEDVAVVFDLGNIGAFQIDGGHVGPFQVGALEIGMAKVGRCKDRLAKGRVGQVCSSEFRILGVSHLEVGRTQVGTIEMGKRQHRILEVGEYQVGLFQMRVSEIGMSEIGALQSSPDQVGQLKINILPLIHEMC